MDKHRLLDLIDRYLAGQATVEEIREIDRWYDEFDKQPDLPADAISPAAPLKEKTILQSKLS